MIASIIIRSGVSVIDRGGTTIGIGILYCQYRTVVVVAIISYPHCTRTITIISGGMMFKERLIGAIVPIVVRRGRGLTCGSTHR